MKLLIIASVLALVAVANAGKVVFCYYGTWANGRDGNGKFTPSHIDPNLCTHIGYSFFGLTWADGTIRSLDAWRDFKDNNNGYVKEVVDLKKKNPNLKVIAVVGGYNEGSPLYSNVAADPAKRKNFIQSALSLLQQHGFDGLDLDWEYPGQRGGAPNDKDNFVTWLKEIKTELKKKNYHFSIAVGATTNLAEPAYNIAAISQHVDLINLMTYDINGHWSPVTSQNAPLQGSGTYTIKKVVEYWLSQGAPANKLTLGLPFYGRSFVLANPNTRGLGAGAAGAGSAGPYTKEAGFLGYNEICIDKSWNVVFDNNERQPFAQKGNQWVGFDNAQSIEEKAKYALSKNLAGIMIWSIETDDFRGDCGAGKFPLLKKAFNSVK